MRMCSKPTHWFRSMTDQCRGRPCAYHPCSLHCDGAPEEIDFGIAGTPCHPYSTQRSGRWEKTGPTAVMAHEEFGVAMHDFFEWMTTFVPKALVFEQVAGFDKPLYSGANETPYTMSFGSIQ